MRVLLTGANGLLGQHLLRLLSQDTALEVIATGLGQNRNIPGNYSYHACDLTNRDQVSHLVNQIRPDYIIHAAARTQVDWCEQNKSLCWTNNVDATKYLLEAAQHLDCHFQYISTDFVFSGEKGNYVETDVPNPVNYYGESKLAAEKLVMSAGLPWSIARTVLVYGVASQMSRSNIIVWIWNSLKNNQQIRVVTDQVRTPTFVEDLAFGSKLMLAKRAEGIFHISGKEVVTPYDLAIQVAKQFDLDEKLIKPVDSSTFSQPGQRPKNTTFNIDKARNALNYEPGQIRDRLELLKTQLQDYSG